MEGLKHPRLSLEARIIYTPSYKSCDYVPPPLRVGVPRTEDCFLPFLVSRWILQIHQTRTFSLLLSPWEQQGGERSSLLLINPWLGLERIEPISKLWSFNLLDVSDSSSSSHICSFLPISDRLAKLSLVAIYIRIIFRNPQESIWPLSWLKMSYRCYYTLSNNFVIGF